MDFADVERKLGALPDFLLPIATTARRLLSSGPCLEDSFSTMLIGHRPQIAPQNYALCLFRPFGLDAIERYEQLHRIVIPPGLRPLYSSLNGARLLEMSVFGMPPSMANDPPLLARGVLHSPLDLGTAVRAWAREYPAAHRDEFHFGSRATGWDSVVGYFMRPNGQVIGYLRGSAGKDAMVGQWEGFAEWLRAELSDTEAKTATHYSEVTRRRRELDGQYARRPSAILRSLLRRPLQWFRES